MALTFVQSCKQPRFPDSLQGPPHKWALTAQLYADENPLMPIYRPHVRMLSGVSSPVVNSADGYERRQDDARYTTGLQFIFAKRAVMLTLVGGLAAVVAVM